MIDIANIDILGFKIFKSCKSFIHALILFIINKCLLSLNVNIFKKGELALIYFQLSRDERFNLSKSN